MSRKIDWFYSQSFLCKFTEPLNKLSVLLVSDGANEAFDKDRSVTSLAELNLKPLGYCSPVYTDDKGVSITKISSSKPTPKFVKQLLFFIGAQICE